MNDDIKKLEHIGYNNFFESKRESLGLMDYTMARIIAEHKELYIVRDSNNEYSAKITGKRIFDANGREDFPAVGDWVAITIIDDKKAVIQTILPRRTILQKKYSGKEEAQIMATNVDCAFIVESIGRDYNLNRIERYIVLVAEGGLKTCIVLNKIDLVSNDELNSKVAEIKHRFFDTDVILTSTTTENGLSELAKYIEEGKTYCFLGSSGVGKSSLINKLFDNDNIKTGQISESTGRGKHTTTAREMYFLKGGGIIIDNPGTREVGVGGSAAGIKNVFDEIIKLSNNCKFADCTHSNEPGCAILKAIKNNELDMDKYHNYIKLRKEAAYYEMSSLEKKEKDHKFGKFKKNALDQINNLK